MFRGQFQHSVDAKGRVSVPARFRESSGRGESGGKGESRSVAEERFVVTPALFDPCLHVYPLEAWERFEEKIADLPSLDPNVVRFRRLYVSAACECELDKAGRVLVPGHLRERAGLEHDVLWAGMGKHLELWSLDRWQAALAIDPVDEESFKRAVLEQIKI